MRISTKDVEGGERADMKLWHIELWVEEEPILGSDCDLTEDDWREPVMRCVSMLNNAFNGVKVSDYDWNEIKKDTEE